MDILSFFLIENHIPMKIAVTGLTGFVGSHLKLFLKSIGENEVIGLGRKDFSEEGKAGLLQKLQGCDVVINLAGTPIQGRWTAKQKETILNSRIETTRKLVAAINALPKLPELFISTSAIGYYSNVGLHTEESQAAREGFLSHVCQEWENEAHKVDPRVRLVILRFGLILGADGGVWPKVVKPLKQMKVSVVFGSGEQPFSWIHIDDLMRIIELMINDKQLSGVFNCVAPDLLTWLDFMAELKRVYNPFMQVKLPEWLLRIIWLDGADMLVKGQQVLPMRLQQQKFEFQYPHLKDAVTDLVTKS